MEFGAKILLYGTKSDSWEGPYKFIWKTGETVCIQLPTGRKTFRSNVVKKFNSQGNSEDEAKVHVINEFNPDFKASRKKELNGLFESGVFRQTHISNVEKGTRIYGLKFLDEVKKDILGKPYSKSRLVAQNYLDKGAKTI